MKEEKKTCTVCYEDLTFAVVYTHDYKKGICMACYDKIKIERQNIINAMPDVPEVDAPKGYKFVKNRWFLDELAGRIYSNIMYERLGQ